MLAVTASPLRVLAMSSTVWYKTLQSFIKFLWYDTVSDL